MQCVEIDAETGIAYLANAGHPFPVHFSRKRAKCGIVPVFGNLLNNPLGPDQVTAPYQQYPLEMEPGDLMVLITDGLTEGHVLKGDAFGYRFTEVIESGSNRSVHDLGEGILDAWKTHPRELEATDDASVLVIALREFTRV
jgi:serine phosphatase RsbU (regulator of sigma subunit)